MKVLFFFAALLAGLLILDNEDLNSDLRSLNYGIGLKNLERCQLPVSSLDLETNVAKDLKLVIVPKNISEWNANMMAAREFGEKNRFSNNQQPLDPKYRKYFGSSLIIEASGFKPCFLRGKIRLTGDFTDHLKGEGLVPSVKFELRDGSIFGASDFKLFRLESRGGGVEVLISYIARTFGWLAPESLLIDVGLGNSDFQQMIFQEDLTASFLERNLRREGPVLEVNEEFKIGTLRKRDFDIRFSFADLANQKYLNKGGNYAAVSLQAITRLNLAVLGHQEDMYLKGKCCVDSYADRFDNNLLAWGNKKNKQLLDEYDSFLLAFGGRHGLVPTNRKFYYDPLRKILEPIVYDSNSKIPQVSDQDKWVAAWADSSPASRAVQQRILGLSFVELRAGLLARGLTDESVDSSTAFLKKLSHLSIRPHTPVAEFSDEDQAQESSAHWIGHKHNDGINDYYLLTDWTTGLGSLCEGNLKVCESISLTPSSIKRDLNGIDHHLLGEFHFHDGQLSIRKGPDSRLVGIGDGVMSIYGSATAKINTPERVIELSGVGPDHGVVISNADLSDWSVFVTGFDNDLRIGGLKSIETDRDSEYDRIDSMGMTGCLTIVDSLFDKTKLFAMNSTCEDSINIFKSRGSIAELGIENAWADALDVDFSDIEIEDFRILNAGNDCLDFSTSSIQLQNGAASYCRDKAISAGEKSTVVVQNFKAHGSHYGVASKDGSKVYLGPHSINDVDICLARYQKKQVFSSGEIILDSNVDLNCTERLGD